VSFESETTALVVFWLPCAAPDMIEGSSVGGLLSLVGVFAGMCLCFVSSN
jgi:hypothetical protein